MQLRTSCKGRDQPHTMVACSMSSRLRKQLQRLAQCPADYEWRELETLLSGLGFRQSSGKGSRVAFHHPKYPDRVIRLHKPHGRNPPTVLRIYVRNVIGVLSNWGYLNE